MVIFVFNFFVLASLMYFPHVVQRLKEICAIFFELLLIFWVRVKRVMHCFFIVELQEDEDRNRDYPVEKKKRGRRKSSRKI